MSDALLTAREAAALLKLSLPAFYAWRRRHTIPSAIESRALRFHKSDLVRPATTTRLGQFAEAGRTAARRTVVPSRDWVEAGRRHG